jgi:hypothetical protein
VFGSTHSCPKIDATVTEPLITNWLAVADWQAAASLRGDGEEEKTMRAAADLAKRVRAGGGSGWCVYSR